jgi:formylglycine-generating enzyme required for sulfatase activity
VAENVQDILEQVVERRAVGEAVADADILAAYPEHQDELAEQLEALRSIHLAMLDARRAHPDAAEPSEAPLSRAALPHVPGYSILWEIGRGAQGCVYAAMHEITGRRIALKIVGTDSPLVSSRQRLRFGREADLMAAIDHANVVKIIDRGFTPSGALFLAMDYVEGPTLDDWLADRRTSSGHFERDVAAIFKQVALAVHDVHECGIVHRDLKPTNVRVDRHGNPHVLDFGLARVQSIFPELGGEGMSPSRRHATLTGQIVGSLPWASPEQAAGRVDEVDRQSDVYSLGVMLYQALSGEFPYRVDVELRQLLENIATVRPKVPIRLGYRGRPPCSPAFEAIVLKAIAKERNDRYASAKALADDLDAWLTGRPVLADVARQRHRGRSAMLIVATLLLLVSLAAGWFVASRPQPPKVLNMPMQTNSVGMNLIRLPPGPIIVGSPLEEPGRRQNERQHITRVERPFWLAAHEVTRGQYRAVMGRLPEPSANDGTSMSMDHHDDLPVTDITWADATEFCRRLSQKEGRLYRLPTEIEWEYAARAGAMGRFGGSGDADRMAWHQSNGNSQLHPVASRWPNHWGFFDMHGNAAEWCQDLYGSTYPTSQSIDTRFPEAIYPRVVRGGSARHPADECRSASREPVNPQYSETFLGFRVAMEDPASSTP